MVLEPATLIRGGGSALLAVAGLVAMVLARGKRGAFWLGLTFAAWGTQLASANLLSDEAAAAPGWRPALVVLLALRCVGMVGVMIEWPAPLRPHERRSLLLAFAAAAGVFALVVSTLALQPGSLDAYRATLRAQDGNPLPLYLVDQAKNALWAAVPLLFALRYLASGPEDGALRRKLAWGAVLISGSVGLGMDLHASAPFMLWTTIGSPAGIAVFGVAVALLLAATARPDGRPARLAAHAMLGLMLLGAVLQPTDALEDAVVGIQRTVFAFLLVYGMMRLGFLGREIQLRTANRGTMAAAALALVFVVAQVAQNFLSAEYGLLTGGVVAGAFLFAAHPLQRAMERLSSREVVVADALPRRAPGAAASTFKAAVRAARHDGVVSAAEERHLAEVADGLALTPGEMVRLRHEVEAEYGEAR